MGLGLKVRDLAPVVGHANGDHRSGRKRGIAERPVIKACAIAQPETAWVKAHARNHHDIGHDDLEWLRQLEPIPDLAHRLPGLPAAKGERLTAPNHPRQRKPPAEASETVKATREIGFATDRPVKREHAGRVWREHGLQALADRLVGQAAGRCVDRLAPSDQTPAFDIARRQ